MIFCCLLLESNNNNNGLLLLLNVVVVVTVAMTVTVMMLTMIFSLPQAPSHRTDAPDVLVVPTADSRQHGDGHGLDGVGGSHEISAHVTVETSRTHDQPRYRNI